jgi:hypothetical protein
MPSAITTAANPTKFPSIIPPVHDAVQSGAVTDSYERPQKRFLTARHCGIPLQNFAKLSLPASNPATIRRFLCDKHDRNRKNGLEPLLFKS